MNPVAWYCAIPPATRGAIYSGLKSGVFTAWSVFVTVLCIGLGQGHCQTFPDTVSWIASNWWTLFITLFVQPSTYLRASQGSAAVKAGNPAP